MRLKTLTILVFCAAVIAAAVAAIKISTNRTDEARAKAEKAVAAADKAQAEAKAERAKSDAEAEKRRAAEANQKAKADEKAAAEENRRAAADQKAAAEANQKAKEAEAATAKANSEAARARKDEETARLRTAREEKEKAQRQAEEAALKAQAEADRLAAEKLKSDKILAEAKLLELRRIDFQTLERELTEWKRDLEEREQAIRPEKTITDLAWVGGDEDMEVGDDGSVRVKKKEPYLAEKDRTLPQATRRLAKTERLAGEAETEQASAVRSSVVRSLEKLYVAALKENRTIDADFYRKSLKSMYPDWEFKGEEEKKEEPK